MKASLALISAALIASKTYASCFSEELGYPCCSGNNVVFTDDRGKWGVEDRKWCGIADESTGDCWATKLHYPCCTSSDPKVYYTDESGDWSVEHGKWCGIITKKNDSPFHMRGNPFKNIEYYINPYYVEKVDKAISQMTDASLIAKAEKMKTYSNAIWLDSIENMQNWLEVSLKGALAQQQSSSKHVLTVFTVYDLPGRDCHALMSNGELQPKDADMERYKTEFIDVIEEKLKTYNTQPVVLIVEPNSLSQLVTNVETTPACADAEKYYLDGHAYLIKKLGILPNVALYLDIGNALTLGWDDTREAAVKLYANVVNSGAPGIVRGFFDNALQYSPWEDPTATRGPDTEWNPCPDEKRYLEAMYKDLKAAGVKYVNFVSDSAQNGKKIENSDSGNLCIPSGVGIGARPEANPISGMDYVDAFYWIEPFGETIVDTYDEIDMQYGPNCMKKSPKAGEWFQEYFEQGLKNANPPL